MKTERETKEKTAMQLANLRAMSQYRCNLTQGYHTEISATCINSHNFNVHTATSIAKNEMDCAIWFSVKYSSLSVI